MDSLLAMDSGFQGADSGNAAGDSKGQQQQGDFTGKDVVSALRVWPCRVLLLCASMCCLSSGIVWYHTVVSWSELSVALACILALA